jgi:Hint domain
VQAERPEKVEYYHIELETHDVIIAEGAFSESFIDDDSRAKFHNARDYYVRYPNRRLGLARYCAPRLDEGFEIDAARRQIALRAGLLRAADSPHIGPLQGFVDYVGSHRIVGWAQNPKIPEAPVCLDIFVGGELAGQTLANVYRMDLERAGFGSGRHGFEFTPSAGLGFSPAAIEVRRSFDGTVVELTAKARATQGPASPSPRETGRRRAACN